MLTLYYAQGTCSSVVLMTAKTLGIDLNVVNVNIAEAKLEDGRDFKAINPKGYVPALQLENGEIITEVVAVCAYLSSLKSDNALFPLTGKGLIDQLAWFNYLATEIHKSYVPLIWQAYGKETGKEWPAIATAGLKNRYTLINETLASQKYLTGDQITSADFYLFMTMLWADKVKLDLSEFAHIMAFKDNVKIAIEPLGLNFAY